MRLKEFYTDYMLARGGSDPFPCILKKVVSPLFTEYAPNYEYIDFLFRKIKSDNLKVVESKYFNLLYRDRHVTDDLLEDIEYQPKYILIDDTIKSVLIQNMSRYEHLYNIELVKYDPIANYDRKEFTETTYSREHSTMVRGTDTTTDVYGNTTDTEVNGERDNTTTYGESSIDSLRDSTIGRSVDNIRAFDSDVSIEVADNVYSMSGSGDGGKMNDVTTQAEHTDTEHSDEYTNTKTSAEHTDTHTNSGHTDEQTSDTHSTTVESVVSGNVGVTQTVAMLEAEKTFWSDFSFLDIVYKDIINEICDMVY